MGALVASLFGCDRKEPTSPGGLLDPPSLLHVVNRLSNPSPTWPWVNIWVVVIGPDLLHSGVNFQSSAYPDGDPQFTGPFCFFTAQAPQERLLVYLAVDPNSPLDVRLQRLQEGGAARDAWADSLARGLINVRTYWDEWAGLRAVSPPFDPAPPGFGPTDVVRWQWTLVDPGGLISVVQDQADPACTL